MGRMTGAEYRRSRWGNHPTGACEYAASMLQWFYNSRHKTIRAGNLARFLKLDEVTRRVLLGISSPPGEPPVHYRVGKPAARRLGDLSPALRRTGSGKDRKNDGSGA